MLSADFVAGIALLYVVLLFAVAFVGDRRARHGRPGFLRSPLVYTLSISIYCTSWTFYGAVGSAARNGLEFATIYLGPTLVFVGWWLVLRKLVRIGHVHGITSIADMVSSRFGKSPALAAVVTLIAVVATTPYIALQLKAVTTSFQVIGNAAPDALFGQPLEPPDFRTGFWIAVVMAVFTILFGTRNLDAKEQHHGVVAAIALEAVVKLVALLAVGALVVFGLADGPADIFARATPQMRQAIADTFDLRWAAITFLSAAAVLCLPREFQVTVVENADEDHLRTASWLFPLYLFLITLFVVPIAIAGLHWLPAGANPDMFVLTLPMFARQEGVALLAFLGGFSSATSMLIVSCIAVSTMLSNHVIMPVALRLHFVAQPASGQIRRFILGSRRVSIVLMLLLGFLYFRLGRGGAELASMGLISFAGIAQVLPSLIGGLFWRRANGAGALAGLAAGALLWAYTLFLPSFAGDLIVSSDVIAHGLFGEPLLRPHALFGFAGGDPLVHALFWSLSANVLLFVLVSLATGQRPLERLQSALFVDVFRTPAEAASGLIRRSATAYDLSILAQRILGANEARELFRQAAREQGVAGDTPVVDDAFITQVERKLAGSVGAASARAMISQVVSGETISLDALMQIADETARVREYGRQLEEKSRELEAAAGELSAANARLVRLDAEKDDFLSQVSHEVRTPMTSIRSFAEILLDAPALAPAQRERYLRIIHEESLRLTRLLDSTLDLALLERGGAPWRLVPLDPDAALERAIQACHGLAARAGVAIMPGPRAHGVRVAADADRLAQVFINLLVNAIKYNTHAQPFVRVASAAGPDGYEVVVEDNGPGILPEERDRIFGKFMRGAAPMQSAASGAGLGLAISYQIMRRLGGVLELVAREGPGACFRVVLPLAAPAEGAAIPVERADAT
jgi:Na+/proline symporter/nitrogen-specific signal transduction histidine kinase